MTHFGPGDPAFPAASTHSGSLTMTGGIESSTGSSADGLPDDPSWYCTD